MLRYAIREPYFWHLWASRIYWLILVQELPEMWVCDLPGIHISIDHHTHSLKE
jgi:hypothetical protein